MKACIGRKNIKKLSVPWGRCYDHNFPRFSPNFGVKNGVLSKTNVMIKFLQQLAVVLSKKRQYFRKTFRRKYLKNHNIGPWPAAWSSAIVSYRGVVRSNPGKHFLQNFRKNNYLQI
jgi:hypothetical protein